MRTCDSCRFFTHGECHKNAPQAIPVDAGGLGQNIDDFFTKWPQVASDDFCGQYEPEIDLNE